MTSPRLLKPQNDPELRSFSPTPTRMSTWLVHRGRQARRPSLRLPTSTLTHCSLTLMMTTSIWLLFLPASTRRQSLGRRRRATGETCLLPRCPKFCPAGRPHATTMVALRIRDQETRERMKRKRVGKSSNWTKTACWAQMDFRNSSR